MKTAKIFLWLFGGFMALYLAYLGMSVRVLRSIEYLDADAFSSALAAEEPLKSNKYLDALPFPSLQEKSRALMRAYNRRVQVARIVRDRVELLLSMKKISTDVADLVERNLGAMESDNERILRQFEQIADFAEAQYARAFLQRHSPDAEDKARLFAKENEALLRSVDVPISFQ